MASTSRMERIEKIRQAMLLASGDFQWKEIAGQLNIAPQTITTLISSKRAGQDLQDKLEEWLRSHGYWNKIDTAREDPTPYPTSSPPAVQEIHDMLQSLVLISQMEGRCTAARLSLLEGGVKTLQTDLLPRLRRELEADRTRKKG